MTAMMVLQPRDWNDLVSIIVMGLVAIAALVLPSREGVDHGRMGDHPRPRRGTRPDGPSQTADSVHAAAEHAATATEPAPAAEHPAGPAASPAADAAGVGGKGKTDGGTLEMPRKLSRMRDAGPVRQGGMASRGRRRRDDGPLPRLRDRIQDTSGVPLSRGQAGRRTAALTDCTDKER